MRVLFVEDSERLQRWVGRGLRSAGFTVDISGNGSEGLGFAQSSDYDVIILDLMLPGLGGMRILERLRSASCKAAVLILTARDAVEDRVRGLEAGADDYIVKPFAFAELLARIRSVMRRRHHIPSLRVEVGPLVIDTVGRKVSLDGFPVELTTREYALLEYLALRLDVVVSRTEIETHLYDASTEIMSNVVDTLVCALRRKIDLPAGRRSFIRTARGVGYVLEACDGAEATS